jgi:hypothetical protein
MLVQTKSYLEIASRARELGCRVPVGIALLPGNFSTVADVGEFRYHAATSPVRSAWQSVGLDDEGPALPDRGRRGQRTPVIAQEAGPDAPHVQLPLVAFFGAGLLDGPAWRLTVALGMVSSVLASHPRCASPREVRFDAVVERPDGGGCACIEYRGDAFGIIALAREVRRIWADK